MFDIEADVVAALAGLADSVATRVPNPRPDTVIRVTEIGGDSGAVVLSTARLLVECWAAESVAASVLAGSAIDALAATYGAPGAWGGRFTWTGLANTPDRETEQARYQFVAQIEEAS